MTQKTNPDEANSRTQITVQKLAHYFDVTSRALAKVKLSSDVVLDSNSAKKIGEDFLDMAQRYFSDAKHFEKQGDVVNAFAALNYAHGWLDAGARLGVFDVGGDNVLFTVDDEYIRSLRKPK